MEKGDVDRQWSWYKIESVILEQALRDPSNRNDQWDRAWDEWFESGDGKMALKGIRAIAAFRNVDPADLWEDVFMTLLHKLEKGEFTPKSDKPGLANFALGIAGNKAKQINQANSKAQLSDLPDENLEGDSERGNLREKKTSNGIPSREYEDRTIRDETEIERINWVVNIQQTLPEKDRTILEMSANGFSSDEIAKQLNLTPANCRQRLSRLRKKLALFGNYLFTS